MLGRQFVVVGTILSVVATFTASLRPPVGGLPAGITLPECFLVFLGLTLLIGVPWWVADAVRHHRMTRGGE